MRRPTAACGAVIVCGLLAPGCSSGPAAVADRVQPADPSAAIGSWTLAAPGSDDPVTDPIGSTMVISEDGFDRTTVIDGPDRTIEVSESGRWTATPGGALRLDLTDILLVITEGGDVSVETYQPEPDASSARLRLVGDRLVLEMLDAGEPIARYAYRRD